MHARLCVVLCACVYVCMYVYVCRYVYVCMYLCICACMHVCICIYMYSRGTPSRFQADEPMRAVVKEQFVAKILAFQLPFFMGISQVRACVRARARACVRACANRNSSALADWLVCKGTMHM